MYIKCIETFRFSDLMGNLSLSKSPPPCYTLFSNFSKKCEDFQKASSEHLWKFIPQCLGLHSFSHHVWPRHKTFNCYIPRLRLVQEIFEYAPKDIQTEEVLTDMLIEIRYDSQKAPMTLSWIGFSNWHRWIESS